MTLRAAGGRGWLAVPNTVTSAGKAVEVHLSADDSDRLTLAVDELKQEIAGYPGVSDVSDSYLRGKKELQLKLKPGARSLGLTLNDLARQVRHAFYGCEALRLLRDRDEVKVLVRYPASERKSLKHIEMMRIRSSDGTECPFDQVAQAKMQQGYAAIQRGQRRRIIKVMADVDQSVTNANDLRQDLEKRYLPELKALYPGLQ